MEGKVLTARERCYVGPVAKQQFWPDEDGLPPHRRPISKIKKVAYRPEIKTKERSRSCL